MDERFPKYLRTIIKKMDFIAIPNLGKLISILAILGFVGIYIMGAPLERFVFDPELVREGEWWRLFSFPVSGSTGGSGFFSGPFWYLFYVMYIYFVMNALESAWGPAPLTFFTLLSYVAAVVAAFVTDRALPIWYYVLENVSLAFGTLFPETQLYLIVLPVKAKWLAILAGVLLLLQFIMGGNDTKILLAIALSPYLLFFGPVFYRMIRDKRRIAENRRRFRGED